MRSLKRVVWTLFSIGIIALIGFCTKFYQGSGAFWVNNSLSGVLYEIFWCLVFCLILPRVNPWKIAAAVFSVTCALEFLQLWHPPFLEFIRNYFFGRALIGNFFTWSDFPYYLIGCGIGWAWMSKLKAFEKR